MRSVKRVALSETTTTLLSSLQEMVNEADNPAEKAKSIWNNKDNPRSRHEAYEEVRGALKTMATGLARCMYCEDSQGTDIEHYRPKTTYPEHAFCWDNYLWACSHCNSNEKRTMFPLDENSAPLLLNPASDVPEEHLEFVPDTGNFVERTKMAVETVKVLGLNRRENLVRGRATAWTLFCELLENYARAMAGNDTPRANRIRTAIAQTPFAFVLTYLVRMASAPNATANVPKAVVEAVERYPELRALVS